MLILFRAHAHVWARVRTLSPAAGATEPTSWPQRHRTCHRSSCPAYSIHSAPCRPISTSSWRRARPRSRSMPPRPPSRTTARDRPIPGTPSSRILATSTHPSTRHRRTALLLTSSPNTRHTTRLRQTSSSTGELPSPHNNGVLPHSHRSSGDLRHPNSSNGALPQANGSLHHPNTPPLRPSHSIASQHRRSPRPFPAAALYRSLPLRPRTTRPPIPRKYTGSPPSTYLRP